MWLIRPRGVFILVNYKDIMSNFGNYLRDTIAEMKHVHWPTQKQAFLYTILVLVISIIVSLLLGAFDFVFNLGIDAIVNRI